MNQSYQGEAIRLACAYGKLPLEDVRLNAEEFQAMKSNGTLKFGQLPALSIDDDRNILFQSASIMRFVGRYAGLYPLENFELAASIDAIIDEEIDLFTGLACSRYKGIEFFIERLTCKCLE
jgi:glutathione S-transferase